MATKVCWSVVLWFHFLAFFFRIYNDSYLDFSSSLLLKLLDTIFGIGGAQGELLSRCRMTVLHFTRTFLCGHSARLQALLAALSSKIKKALTQHWPSGSSSEDVLVWLYSKWPQSQEGQSATLQLVTQQDCAPGSRGNNHRPPSLQGKSTSHKHCPPLQLIAGQVNLQWYLGSQRRSSIVVQQGFSSLNYRNLRRLSLHVFTPFRGTLVPNKGSATFFFC